jgi:hypothetical protein
MSRLNDTGYTTHSSACWLDVSSNAEKIWSFQYTGGQLNARLMTGFSQGQPHSAGCALRYTNSQDSYTWVADPAGRPYLNTVLTTLDPGQTFAVQKQTAQTLDAYGNVTQSQA